MTIRIEQLIVMPRRAANVLLEIAREAYYNVHAASPNSKAQAEENMKKLLVELRSVNGFSAGLVRPFEAEDSGEEE